MYVSDAQIIVPNTSISKYSVVFIAKFVDIKIIFSIHVVVAYRHALA